MPIPTEHHDDAVADHRTLHGTPPTVVVIGGANVDIKSRLDADAVMRTSNPGRTRIVAGGVGRNIAENLARLGVETTLISTIGRDMLGERLITEAAIPRVDVSHMIRTEVPTGSYTAVLDCNGELLVAVASMQGMEEMIPAAIGERHTLIEQATALILDCNVPVDSLRCALNIARDFDVPTFIDPVSVAKSERLKLLLQSDVRVHTITPNIDELSVLAGQPIENNDDICAVSAQLHTAGVSNVWVRLGARGSFMRSAEASGTREEFIAAPATHVIDVTGAGDAMLAAYVYAILQGVDPVAAAGYGHAAAAITVASEETVCSSMSVATLMAALGALHLPTPSGNFRT